MKKTLSIILTVTFLFLSVCCAAAQSSENRVSAENINTAPGDYVTVPIYIEQNTGFMGFSITITYPQEELMPVSVEKGSALSGILNDSISTSSDNSFKVLYTGTGDITEDCCLFSVTFKVAENAADRQNRIVLSYSQPDTFREGWKDVELSCADFYINVVNEQSTCVTDTTSPDDETESTTSPENNPYEQPGSDVTKLSVRMRNWVNSLAFPLNILAGIFVIPVSYVISIFE